VKLKFFFFSKTLRQRLLKFNGLCTSAADLKRFPCHIAILKLDQGKQTLGDLPWMTVRMASPLPQLAYLPFKEDADIGATAIAVDMKHLEEMFYDRLCACTAKGAECASAGDCCDQMPCLDDGTGTGKTVCGCRAPTESCDTDSDCCYGTPCVDDGTGSGEKFCGCRNETESCERAFDCCTGNPCVNDGAGTTVCGCRSGGQGCSTNNDCCNGLPCTASPTGQLACKCLPKAAICQDDGDCCGGPCTPEAGTNPQRYCECVPDDMPCVSGTTSCCTGICNALGTCGEILE